jgi:CNT family concentrative nucleoside transporter
LRGLIAVPALLVLAWLLSEDRRAIPWRTVLGGTALQIAIGALLIGVPPATRAIFALNHVATALQDATDAGTGFVFGYLAGDNLPFSETHPGAAFILAFKALPLVLVISALSALMFHWRILQTIAAGFAWMLRRSLGIGGPLAIAAAVHIFVGMIEAPLLIRPWLARLQRGEIFAVMTCGMAGIAGTVMVIYAAILGPVVPNALGNILIASVMSTPAALAIAAVMVPFGPGEPGTAIAADHRAANALDALVRGTMEGLRPLVAITAVLLVTIALVALVNRILGDLPLPPAWPHTLQGLFALPFRPLAWLIGLDWHDTHARLVMTYALCGFANFGSLGILIGGLGAMIPERRPEVVALGLRSIVSGTLATLSSGALAGVLSG